MLQQQLRQLNRLLFGPDGLDVSGKVLTSGTPWSLRRVVGVFLTGEILPFLILGILYASAKLDVSFAVLIAAQPVTVLVVIWVLRPRRHVIFEDILPLDMSLTEIVRYAVVWGVGMRLVSVVIVLIQVQVGFWEDITNNPLLMVDDPLTLVEGIIIVIGAVILVPIAEEVFYRGLLYRSLGRHLGLPVAAIISTVVWTVLHGHPVLYPPIFVLGLGLVALYESTGRLWAPVAAHIGFNLSSFVLLLLFPGLA